MRIGEIDPRARPKAHVTHAESRRELFAAVTGDGLARLLGQGRERGGQRRRLRAA
ncbi:hypothetical protein HMPREF0682_2201 [Propionibacterium acidifaciens F0233]|uniref:Uncharacterized protein n=1 Tax=Propionibacterium acidifaciens F0233 TaxID=553198 RepID=U2SBV0_9ACTN|nr:hypothetical protein HMPREF0682_2201 [Propionibacterium acidifaciens F0233]